MADVPITLSKPNGLWIAEPDPAYVYLGSKDRIVFHNVDPTCDCMVRFRITPFVEADLKVPHHQMRNTTRLKGDAPIGEYPYDLTDVDKYFHPVAK